MAAGADIERLPTKPPPHWRKRRRELIVIGSMSVVLILLIAARYAEALSRTPVQLDEELVSALRAAFVEREIVVLALTVAQVNFWSRFDQGLGISAAGFFDERACALPQRKG